MWQQWYQTCLTTVLMNNPGDLSSNSNDIDLVVIKYRLSGWPMLNLYGDIAVYVWQAEFNWLIVV